MVESSTSNENEISHGRVPWQARWDHLAKSPLDAMRVARRVSTGHTQVMKNKATPTLHDNDQPNAALAGGNSGARQIFKLGLDVDLNNAVTAIQCGAGDIKRGQSFSRARLLGWVRTQVNAGHTVHTVYEACGFGYTLHHELVGAGAHSLVTTPMRHTAQRRRKNDRMDARELCVRLARWLDGHRDA